MIVYGFGGEENDDEFRRRALRNALIFLASLKLCSVFCYILFYFVILRLLPKHNNWSEIILYSILTIIFLLIVLAILLVIMAYKEIVCVIIAAIGVASLLAVLEFFLGAAGAIFFIRYGRHLAHFFLAAAFVCLAFSNIPVFANDWYLICTYKRSINTGSNANRTNT